MVVSARASALLAPPIDLPYPLKMIYLLVFLLHFSVLAVPLLVIGCTASKKKRDDTQTATPEEVSVAVERVTVGSV